MNSLEIIGEFFLVEWMWSVSWGISQAPISCVMLALFLWLLVKLPFIRAVLSALLVTLLSFLFFTACIIIGLSIVARLPNPTVYEYALSGVHWESFIGFGLGAIFSLEELFLLRWVHRYTQVSMVHLAAIVVLSNLIGAVLTRAFLITP